MPSLAEEDRWPHRGLEAERRAEVRTRGVLGCKGSFGTQGVEEACFVRIPNLFL